MSEWKETEIGRIPPTWRLMSIDELKAPGKRAIAMGPFGSNIKKENFVEEGIPVIRGNNLTDFYLNEDGYVFLTEEKAEELKGSICSPGDIVITHRGTLGQVGIIRKNAKYNLYIISQSGMKLSCDPAIVDSKFVFFWLKSRIGQHLLLKNVSQTGVPAIAQPTSSLKEVLVPIPPKKEAEEIVKTLSAIQEKIALLHHQNQTLEKIAQTLFKHWFIDFEFPNEEGKPYRSSGGEMVASELGKVPEGWKIGPVGNLFTLQRGYDLPKDKRNEGQYPVIAASGLNGFHDEFKVKGPGVATGRSGIIGNVFLILEEFWPLNTSLFVKKFKRGKAVFVYHFLKNFSLERFNSGSAVPTLNRNEVHNMEVGLPPAELINLLEETVLPLFKKKSFNEKEINTLTKTRDTLLPKLMSGQIRIQDTEKIMR